MLSALLSPLGAGFALACVLLPLWSRWPRWLRRGGIAVAAVLALLTTPLGGNALVAWQESRGTAAPACGEPAPVMIVVLGGGVRVPTDRVDDYAALSEASLHRIFAAVALYRRKPDPDTRLLITGGSYEGVAESVLMAQLATELGVPERAIEQETAARTTWQNAARVAAQTAQRRIWLVTSALHMTRARHAFVEHGFDVCTWPADSRYQSMRGIGYLLPHGSGVAKSEAALHELVGEIGYRLGLLRGADRNPGPPGGER